MANVKRGANLGLATIPKWFKTNGIRKLLDRALWEQGIRLSPEKHHPFKMTHGFRKYFMSHAEQAGMKSINVKILMGHSIGVEDSYYRPEESVISLVGNPHDIDDHMSNGNPHVPMRSISKVLTHFPNYFLGLESSNYRIRKR